ncbi:MAG TPA: hypothetical protein VNN21_04235 [Dehalococcoidia bacterium]|nr:hypothetical protein [Dehalococcoidia bacterium]
MAHTTKAAAKMSPQARAKLPHYDAQGKPVRGARRSQVAAERMKGARGKAMRSTKSKAKPNPKAPLGQGGRFAAVKAKAARAGARNPAAVAAAVGRKKYGAKKMAQLAAKGRKAAR